jgi:competence protein ComEC
MALSLFLGDSVGRRVHPLQSVGLAALIMLTADARQLFDIGFQLSFGAVIAILLLTPRLLGMVTQRGHRTLVWGVVRAAYSLFAVSIAASVGTLPLTGMAFGRLSIVGFIANLIIVPATGVSVVLGIISAAVAPIDEWVASSYASLNRLVLMLTIEGAELAASVPWATVDTLWFRPIDALSYYTALACFTVLGNPPLARRMLIASLAAINASLFWPSADIAEFMAEECRIVMIDVGQGDAILLQSPGGQNVLVDTGPPSRDGSPWGTSVVPLLKRLDVQSLDAVIITHFHDDHAGGLMQVLRTCNVRRLVVPPHIVRTAGALLDRIEVPVTVASRGDILGDSLCRFYVLDPEEVDSNASGDLNNQSLVVKMQFGGVSVLLMGDAERDEEKRLVSCFGGFLESAILKIGHHGSKAGTGEEFLSVVRPEFALISVGRTNRFGHPAGSTVQRLEGAGVEVFRTDESGAVFMATNGRMIRQLHWR